MAKIFHFVVPGILAIIYVTNCYNYARLPTFEETRDYCVGTLGHSGRRLFMCIAIWSGAISREDGRVNVTRLRELLGKGNMRDGNDFPIKIDVATWVNCSSQVGDMMGHDHRELNFEKCINGQEFSDVVITYH